MSINISRRDIQSAYDYANRGLSHARDPNGGQAGRALGKVLDAGVTAAGALGVGVASGRFGPLTVGPVPLDLAGAVGGHLVAFWLEADRPSEIANQVHNLSNGVLAGYLTKLGIGLGTRMRMNAGQTPFTTFTGEADALFSGAGRNRAEAHRQHHPGHNYLHGRTSDHQWSVSGDQARSHGGMPAYGAGAETGGPLTEAELAALAQQVR
jgi:hypothetical protein